MDIKTFFSALFGMLTVLVDNSTKEIWFLNDEVCKALGYANPRDAFYRHVDFEDRKALKYVDCRDSRQSKLWSNPMDKHDKMLINESGLYSLIFGSRLDSCKEFKHWITSEVLPSIRENGGYILGQENLSEEEQNNLKAEITSLQDKVEVLTNKNTQLERKINHLNKETVKLRTDSDDLSMMCEKLIDETISYINELRALKQSQEKVNDYKPAPAIDKIIRVDKEGFLI